MKSFYQQYLADKSFSLLTGLKRQFKFVLIGGWAVYFYTKALKSKDIDIIVDFSQLDKIKKEFSLEKNERLKKYQIKTEEMDIDIYLPHYSELGMPAEEIIKRTNNINGFVLPEKEVLFLTKLKAFHDRKVSVKGQKDLIDMVALILMDDFDFRYLSDLIKQYRFEKYWQEFKKIIKVTKEIPELNLNQHVFAKKRKIFNQLAL